MNRVRGHGVHGSNWPEDNRFFSWFRATRQKHHRKLPDDIVESGFGHFLEYDGIRLSQKISALAHDGTRCEAD